MQKFLIILAVFVIAGTSDVYAQTSASAFEISNQSREIQRRATVASNLKLSPKEEDKFWQKYDTYRAQAKISEKKRFGLISELAENISLMSEKEADSLATRALKLELNNKKLKQKHMLGLKRVLDDANLFKYYQIETKLDAIFEYGLTKNIPLVSTDGKKLIDLQKVSK